MCEQQMLKGIDTNDQGDRIATFMIQARQRSTGCDIVSPQECKILVLFQLNNVEDGGYTVFPATFASAVPTKGSAIFWFNTFSDGTPDLSTAHALCPVVLGQKWGKPELFLLFCCS